MPAAGADPVSLSAIAADLLDYVGRLGTRDFWSSLGYLLGWRWAVLCFLPAIPLIWLVRVAAPRRWWLPFLTGLSVLFIAVALVPWPQRGVLHGAVSLQGFLPWLPLRSTLRVVLGLLHAGLILLLLAGVYKLARAAARRRAVAGSPRAPYGSIALICAGFAALVWAHGTLVNPQRPARAAAGVVVLPDFHEAGLAYLLVKAVHFVSDCGRGQILALSWWRFIGWMTFFPTYRTGPIERYHDFCTQVLRCRRRFRTADLLIGCARIGCGALLALFTFFIAARLLPRLLERVAAAVEGGALAGVGAAELWLLAVMPLALAYMLLYSYSELAIGLCRLIGYRAAENFHWSPLSANLAELWSRTHMTMTRSFRDYCFMPLMRRGPFRRRPAPEGASAARELGALLKPSANYFITFILCGLWHAPTLQAICWGALMAGGMVGFDLWTWLKQRWRRGRAARRHNRIGPIGVPPAGGTATGGMAAAVGRHALRRWSGRALGILITAHFVALVTFAVYNPHICGAVLRELLSRPVRLLMPGSV